MNDTAKTEMLDISTLVPELIAHEMHHPKTGEEIGITVNLLPTTDEKIKRLSRQMQDKRNHLAARGKTLKAEELEAFRLDLAATAIQDWNWHGNIGFNGSKPECNQKNIKAVCSKLDWFLDEIDEVLGDGKAFFID